MRECGGSLTRARQSATCRSWRIPIPYPIPAFTLDPGVAVAGAVGAVGDDGVTSSSSVPLSWQHETWQHSIVFLRRCESVSTTLCVILPLDPLALTLECLRANVSEKAICVSYFALALFHVKPSGA